MKKTSFVIAILASALLAGACGKKKEPAAPMAPTEGSAAPAEPPAAGSGSGSGMGSN
jgi:PBP1b-binding outer membrane lipoprotein LpoB